MVRQGFIEETYHTFAYHPFTDADGNPIGIRNFSTEETDAVVAARRLGTVRDLIESTALARSLPDFTAYALETIASNPDDISFALMYTVTPETSKPTKLPIKEVRLGWEENLRLGVNVTCCVSVPWAAILALETNEGVLVGCHWCARGSPILYEGGLARSVATHVSKIVYVWLLFNSDDRGW